MKPILAPLLIGFSVLAACQTMQPTQAVLQDDALCTLRPIAVSEEVRNHLRVAVTSEPLLNGYARFLRDIAAHNAKVRQHCGAG